MNVTITIKENLEELPGTGGSFGVNRFLREDYPEGSKEIDSWILALWKISDKVDTHICNFHVVNNATEKVVARGMIENGKKVVWE